MTDHPVEVGREVRKYLGYVMQIWGEGVKKSEVYLLHVIYEGSLMMTNMSSMPIPRQMKGMRPERAV